MRAGNEKSQNDVEVAVPDGVLASVLLQLLLHVAVLPRDRPVQRGGLVEDRRALNGDESYMGGGHAMGESCTAQIGQNVGLQAHTPPSPKTEGNKSVSQVLFANEFKESLRR